MAPCSNQDEVNPLEGSNPSFSALINMKIRDALLVALQKGFEISNSEMSVACINEGSYLVEVYDPLDEETKQPFDPKFNQCNLYKLMGRIGDYSQRMFPSAIEAVDFYLALIEEARQ
jgi:hypothetical protein